MEQLFPYLAALASLVAIVSAVLKWGRPVRTALHWLLVHSARYQVWRLQRQVADLEGRLVAVQTDAQQMNKRLADLETTTGRLLSRMSLDHNPEAHRGRQTEPRNTKETGK